jgi:L-asparaginase/Glu-tRNA(Gln) amidotransferase subunit D
MSMHDDYIGNSAANMRNFNVKKDCIEHSTQIIDKLMPKVLVICTGGTFTMINTPKGYVAQRGVVNRFKLHLNLHDP